MLIFDFFDFLLFSNDIEITIKLKKKNETYVRKNVFMTNK